MAKIQKSRLTQYLPIMAIILLFGAVSYPSIKTQYLGKSPEPPPKIVEKLVHDKPVVTVNTVKLHVLSITDGDTFRCDIALPLGITLVNQRIRCLGYDAFEMNEIQGVAAKNELEMLLEGSEVFGMTGKDEYDSFGRVLLTVYCRKGDEVIPVAKHMLDKGFGKVVPTKELK